MQSELTEPLKKAPLVFTFGDSTLQFCTKLRIEGFFGKNLEALNSDNQPLDQVIIPARHTYDINTIYKYGEQKLGESIVTIKATLRNKGVWGDPESIASTDRSTVKIGDVVGGEHFHSFNRHVPWFRELWIESTINDMFCLNFYNVHRFTAGLFPFELGRGISLGAAYATDPDFLGFYSPNAVDQYAPGFKLSGALDYDGLLDYDLYVAILTNRSDTLTNVGKQILAQEYGRQCEPARGFGKINWLWAGRLQWHLIRDEVRDVVLEPYALFHDQREQRVEFLGDSESKLGTLGFAVDANLGNMEWGFEFAQNVGRQQVKGWDRNETKFSNRDGTVVTVNSQVVAIASSAPDLAGKSALVTSGNQKVIRGSIRAQEQNGLQIDASNLKNSKNRFRNPYTNHFDGYMAVWDMSYLCCKGFKVSATAGIATGGENPNKDLDAPGDSNRDTTYSGFISLQEQYSGKRVQSAFLMSGSGKVPRILSIPSEGVDDPFPERTSQFTNLIFVGVGCEAKSSTWTLNPNILSYWQEHPSRIHRRALKFPGTRLDDYYASTWLGIEFNLFADLCLNNSMRLYGVGSVFLPGTHYDDIQGIPLTRPQQQFINAQANVTDPTYVDRVTLMGTSPAVSLNVGMEYKF